MESLSRPFHSGKLSNATTFSAENDYDGVFSGHRHNYAGASPIDVQHYREIFGNSLAASSIPVLDLSTLGEPSDALNLTLNFRSSKPDYSKIFGGFRDEDVSVSYEQLFGRDKARAPSSTSSSSPDSDNPSHQSSDALKQFNMSYSKISQKSKDGIDGTRHVTQLHATPGFTCFIDEAVPPLMEAKKHESTAVHGSLDSSKKSKHHPGDLKVHPSTVSSPDASESAPGAFSPAYFEEELDVNSAGSASAAALKKAIEKAQESIRIAKESVGRKKKGLRSFSNKGRMGDVNTGEEQKCKDGVKRVFERVTASSHVGRDRKCFMDSEKLFVAKKFIDEIHGKFSESTKECRLLDSAKKDEYATLSSVAIDTAKSSIEPLDFLHEDQTDNISVDDYEGKTTATIVSNSTQVTCETVEVDVSRESKANEDDARLSNGHELVRRFIDLSVCQKVEDEKKVVPEEAVLQQEYVEIAECYRKKSDDEATDNGLEDASEWLEHEKESKDDHTTGVHKEEETSDNSIQESKESAESCDDNLEESDASLQDECEMKEEDNYRDERKEGNLDDFCDQEEPDEILSGDNNVSENDVQSESSSKEDDEEEEEESNIQLPHEEIPEIGCTNDHQESQEPLNEKEKTMKVNEEMKAREYREKENEIRETGPSKVTGKENQRRINDVSDREREREKDRLAVDRAIREARERARERAERAAVEKATEEIRQRMMADAKEKAAKASAQSKLRAERAAVEKATSEARQRALEKAMSSTSESALRSKAKLEKDNRIMERAAKALAEKEKRDLLAQKEQAERNRLAENLDVEIKRWSRGKEGNLRALLSTLQYILGGESGWQPVTLTEIVATSAVKKAYRKATLCVHPDKLQQRGASIQQKYVCEKVFDLLKAAWNKSNSEEK